MRRECRERFPRHRLQRKPLVRDTGMHHGTCVTHVPRCMSGSLTRGGGENVTGIPGACATRYFTYLARGPWEPYWVMFISVFIFLLFAIIHWVTTLQWCLNGRDSVSNHQSNDCLLNRLFRRRSKTTPKLCVTGLCAGKSPGTGGFPA